MIFTRRFFLQLLILTGFFGLSVGAQQQPLNYKHFVDAAGRAEKNPIPSEFSGSPYMLYEAAPGVKVRDLKEQGIEVVRQLNPPYYIVRAKRAGEREEDLRDKSGILAGTFYPANNIWKLSPSLQKNQEKQFSGVSGLFNIRVNNIPLFKAKLATAIPGAELIGEYLPAGLLQIRCTFRVLYNELLPLPEITFIAEAEKDPKEESLLQDANLAVNKINLLHHKYPHLNGSGITISLKEQKFSPDDIDLRGRYLQTGQEAETISRHATEMATIMAGAGNSAPISKGVAWAATLASSDYQELLPDPDAYFTTNNISVQNHSYGTAIENYYGATAHAYDVQTHQNTALVHVFSAGNDGTATDTSGTYKGVEGFASLTGNFKMAKNVLVTGALDSLGMPDKGVSRGPAYDGRIKPEVVAYSAGGSSNAAALVSGVVSLLQQAYQEENGSLPPSALVKALLVNSAEDTGPAGPDFISGYGNVNAEKAYTTLAQEHYFVGSLGHAQEVHFNLPVPAGLSSMKISLVWNDPAAEPNAAKALVNDLDLELIFSPDESKWLPWVLNTYPHPDSLKQLPERAADHLNTVEQISLTNPEEGEYILRVKGFDVPEGRQTFFIVYQWEEADEFRWTYPTGSDNMPHLGEGKAVFRWESTYAAETGILEYSSDFGKSWEIIEERAELSAENYTWNAPDNFKTAIARMRVGQEIYLTDTFTISRSLRPSVGFNCSDSVMLSWKAAEGAEAYRVFSMQGGRYLDMVAQITDTFFVFQKENFPEKFFAVAPVLAGGEQAVRSITIDYASQGVDCYLAYFNVRGEEEGVQLALQLGTTYQVNRVHFERKIQGSFITYHTTDKPESTSLSFLDLEAQQGVNEYRARLELANGQELITETAMVYFLTELPFFVFPNPVGRNEDLQIFTKDFKNEKVDLQLFDIRGVIVLEQELISEREGVSVEKMNPGMYFYTLSSGDTRRSGKLLIY